MGELPASVAQPLANGPSSLQRNKSERHSRAVVQRPDALIVSGRLLLLQCSLAIRKPLTMSDTHALLALVDQWRDAYNDDPARMVRDCYAPDCKVYPMGKGVIDGHAGLLHVEEVVLHQAPRRTMSVERRHVSGNVVCVEAVLHDPDQGADWTLPFIAVLTVENGRIAIDRSYADWSRWPGL